MHPAIGWDDAFDHVVLGDCPLDRSVQKNPAAPFRDGARHAFINQARAPEGMPQLSPAGPAPMVALFMPASRAACFHTTTESEHDDSPELHDSGPEDNSARLRGKEALTAVEFHFQGQPGWGMRAVGSSRTSTDRYSDPPPSRCTK